MDIEILENENLRFEKNYKEVIVQRNYKIFPNKYIKHAISHLDILMSKYDTLISDWTLGQFYIVRIKHSIVISEKDKPIDAVQLAKQIDHDVETLLSIFRKEE